METQWEYDPDDNPDTSEGVGWISASDLMPPRPDPLTITIEFVSGFVVSALVIWFIVRLTNRRARLPSDAP